MRSGRLLASSGALGWLWAAASGGWTLVVCALLARGADVPALAALGSAAWVGVGVALGAIHARSAAGLVREPGRARQRIWPALAPNLAAALTLSGALRQAYHVPQPVWIALAAALGGVLAACLVLTARALSRRDPRLHLRALVLAGVPATLVGLAAPLRLWIVGVLPHVAAENVLAFAFGTIPGTWCAGTWLWSSRVVARGARER